MSNRQSMLLGAGAPAYFGTITAGTTVSGTNTLTGIGFVLLTATIGTYTPAFNALFPLFSMYQNPGGPAAFINVIGLAANPGSKFLAFAKLQGAGPVYGTAATYNFTTSTTTGTATTTAAWTFTGTNPLGLTAGTGQTLTIGVGS